MATQTDFAYVTQEMWDRAQKALRNVLPLVEREVPLLSTSGTAITLRDEVRAVIVGSPTSGRESMESKTLSDTERALDILKFEYDALSHAYYQLLDRYAALRDSQSDAATECKP